MTRLEEIAARKLEIRKMLNEDDGGTLDLRAIERELIDLDLERDDLEERSIGGVAGGMRKISPPTGRFVEDKNGTTFERGSFSAQGAFVPERQAAASAGELRAFRLGDDLAHGVGIAHDGVGLGAILRGCALGDWSGVPVEKRTMLSSGAAAAVPGYTTLGIVEKAMAESAIFPAGAMIVPLTSPQAKVARVVTVPDVEFAPESADRDLTDGAFQLETGTLDAFSAWLYTTVSIEAFEDCDNLESVVMDTFSRQLSRQFDTSGLGGVGTTEPLGIGRMTNALHRVNEITGVGAVASYLPFVQAAGKVFGKAHKPSSVMLTTDTWTTLQSLVDTTHQPLMAPPAYGKLAEYVSDELPRDLGLAGDEHAAIVGDFSKLMIGVRTDMTLEVSRTGAGFKRGNVEIRGYVRFGSVVTDPTAFTVLSGIVPGDAEDISA